MITAGVDLANTQQSHRLSKHCTTSQGWHGSCWPLCKSPSRLHQIGKSDSLATPMVMCKFSSPTSSTGHDDTPGFDCYTSDAGQYPHHWVGLSFGRYFLALALFFRLLSSKLIFSSEPRRDSKQIIIIFVVISPSKNVFGRVYVNAAQCGTNLA